MKNFKPGDKVKITGNKTNGRTYYSGYTSPCGDQTTYHFFDSMRVIPKEDEFLVVVELNNISVILNSGFYVPKRWLKKLTKKEMES